MARKVLFIVFLLSLLVGFFYYKPLFEKKKPEPSMLDRMPNGEFIGKVNILEVARESSGMMFFNKVSIRDFAAPEFLLAQGKGYGLNLQKPIYFFVNDETEWGALIEVTDSSKIRPGIERIRKDFDLKDSIVGQHKVHVIKSEQLYFAYDRKWLFIYKGNQFPKRLYHVKFAEKDDIKGSWKAFMNEKIFRNEHLIVYSNSKKLRSFGVETALFSHDSDSNSVYLRTYIRNTKPLGISFKEPGLSFVSDQKMERLINVHLDVKKLKSDKSDPLYQYLAELGRKISFPTDAFFDAWEGDLSFHQGGVVKVNETFVETVLDDNFNLSEVENMRQVEVPGFAFLMSWNEHQKEFLSQLFAKGILRKVDKRYYLLTSPPLKLMTTKDHLFLHSTEHMPKSKISNENVGKWSSEGTEYGFSIDSLNKHEFFGTIQIPIRTHLKKRKLI